MGPALAGQRLASRGDHLRLAPPQGVEIDQEEPRARREGDGLLHAQLGIEQVHQPALYRLGLSGNRFIEARREDVRPAPQQQVIRLAPFEPGARRESGWVLMHPDHAAFADLYDLRARLSLGVARIPCTVGGYAQLREQVLARRLVMAA